jgi:hypothetical protein
MASVSDQVVFSDSVEAQDNQNLFESKKWTYITDSSSSNGAFSGQIQFDLNTLSSQNQWTDLSQAYITFPVKLTLRNTVTTAPGAATINAATIKNGFHQFVDSVQVVLGGSTIQSSQIFTNIDTNYKILTEWSKDTLQKYGPTLGISLDDLYSSADTSIGVTESLDNAAVVTAATGFNIWQARNQGVEDRCLMFNNNSASTAFGKSLLTTNQAVVGKSNGQADATVATVNDIFVLYALGTIRLADIADSIKKLPVMKGLKGFIYVNYNSSTHTLTNSGSATISAISNQAVFGRCCPAVLNNSSGGVALAATTAPLTFTADVSGVASSTLTTATPIQTNATLYAPYYIATPEVDRSLSMKKTIRYNERFVTQFNISANGTFNGTLSPGISNPKRVILYPFFSGPTSGGGGNTGFLTNPLLSPFDGVPSTTSPFACLKDLQVYCGNVPMFQQPVSMDFQNFMNEVAQNGADGGLVDQTASGLLSQRLWNQLYRYYTVNVGRRMNSEDGASKSIQLSCTNATTSPMSVVAIIWYEREIVVDTASGQVSQNM